MIVRDLMVGDLTVPPQGRVRTSGYVREGDLRTPMEWSSVPSLPGSGWQNRVAVPLPGGRYAIPHGLPTEPSREPNPAAVEDMIRRGYTFRDEGGTDLIWEGTGRQGPLWGGEPVHRRYAAPYPITCSHFTGILLEGWEYSSTTYVVDTPFRTGWYVPLDGLGPVRAQTWQAHRQARLFHNRGDLWLCSEDQLRRGDILFFSEQNPEKQNENVKAKKIDAYFLNIFHVAQYIGAGTLLQAATPESPTGVYELPLDGYLKSRLTFAARPGWAPPPSTPVSRWDGRNEHRLIPAAPTS